MFPRQELHACALTHTISLSYRGISLSYALFHFPRAISIEQRFSSIINNGLVKYKVTTTGVCIYE